MRTPADVAGYLSRLSQIDLRIDEAIARTRGAAARGLLPPRFILERARTQVQSFLQPPAPQNLLVAALERRSALIEGLPTMERTQAIAEAVRLVDQHVRPAWQRILGLMDDLHPRTTADAGLWRMPDGAGWPTV